MEMQITQHLDNQLRKLQDLQQKISYVKQHDFLTKEIHKKIQLLKQQKNKLKNIKEKIGVYKQEKQRIKKEIIAKQKICFSPKEIQEFFMKVNSSLQIPKGNPSEVPIQFSSHFLQSEMILKSSLYFRYSNNSSYLQLQKPQYSFVQNTKKNVQSIQQINNDQKTLIVAKDLLVVQFSLVNQEMSSFKKNSFEKPVVIYSTNQTTPTIYQFQPDFPQSITISNNTIIKARTMQVGQIESDILELEIKIQKDSQQNGEFTNNMERPIFFLSQDSNVKTHLEYSQFEEELLQNNNFVSWHENNLSTPREQLKFSKHYI